MYARSTCNIQLLFLILPPSMPPRVVLVDPWLDQSNLYYVYLSDGSSFVKVTLVLSGFNYHSRVQSTCTALGGKMKLEFVDGSILVLVDPFDNLIRVWNK